MKGIIILLVVVYAAVGRAQNTLLVDECPKDQEQDWTIELLIRHEDCNKFYKCTFGKPVEMKCPSNLWFNLETQQCDWRDNVDCSDRNVPDESTTIGLPTEEYTTIPTTPEVTNTPTSGTITTPVPTTPVPTTPVPTSPEPDTPEPTTPEPTTEPTTTTTTTTAPPTTTTSTTTTAAPITFLPNGCPTNPHIHWLVPHENDCNSFYYCVWGQLVQRECPSTLHFNRVIQVCDWPWDAGCPASFNKHLDSRKLLR